MNELVLSQKSAVKKAWAQGHQWDVAGTSAFCAAVRLGPNNRSPIPKRPFAYTQILGGHFVTCHYFSYLAAYLRHS